jgi:hypothetical protein
MNKINFDKFMQNKTAVTVFSGLLLSAVVSGTTVASMLLMNKSQKAKEAKIAQEAATQEAATQQTVVVKDIPAETNAPTVVVESPVVEEETPVEPEVAPVVEEETPELTELEIAQKAYKIAKENRIKQMKLKLKLQENLRTAQNIYKDHTTGTSHTAKKSMGAIALKYISLGIIKPRDAAHKATTEDLAMSIEDMEANLMILETETIPKAQELWEATENAVNIMLVDNNEAASDLLTKRAIKRNNMVIEGDNTMVFLPYSDGSQRLIVTPGNN